MADNLSLFHNIRPYFSNNSITMYITNIFYYVYAGDLRNIVARMYLGLLPSKWGDHDVYKETGFFFCTLLIYPVQVAIYDIIKVFYLWPSLQRYQKIQILNELAVCRTIFNQNTGISGSRLSESIFIVRVETFTFPQNDF